MGNMYLAKKSSNKRHHCELTVKYRPHTTSKMDDSLAYTFQGGTYKFYQVMETLPDMKVRCRQYRTQPWGSPIPTLNFAQVGVFAASLLTGRDLIMNVDNFAGKFIKVGNLFATIGKNVLQER